VNHRSIRLAAAADAAIMISAIGSAMSGMASALGRFDRAAARTAQPDAADPVGDRVEQITAQRSFEANLATVRTADEMLGSLIDIVA
jgi:flagellar hook protein FlgE